MLNKIDEACVRAFEDMKFRKTDLRFIVYRIDEKEQIVIEREGAKDQGWEAFMAGLPAKEFRYAVFDVEFTNADNMKISKLIFVYWSPEGVPIKARMIYAGAKEGFKSKLSTFKELVIDRQDHPFQEVINAL